MTLAPAPVQAEAPRNTAVVYGVYINPAADWRRLIRLQLYDLRCLGVFSVADLHVVVSNPSRTEEVAAFFDALPIDIANIEFFHENKFEYPALFYLWNLASGRPDYKYIAYLHTKGMSYAKRRRDKVERALTHFTFAKWAQVLRIFDAHADIHKIGLFPAHQEHADGLRKWIWFNFWWVRSSFVRALPKPEISTDRHYYEHWLGLPQRSEDDIKDHCYSIYRNERAYFSAEEAVALIRLLHWKLKYRQLYRVRSLFTALRKWRSR